jgi:hypothetical protein
MKKLLNPTILFLITSLILSCQTRHDVSSGIPDSITLTKADLLDKIKGGWAGQMIGVTYGAPTEFKYHGTIIPDSVEIPWPESGYCQWWFDNTPGIYDDIYMDLTFVEVFEKYGLDAPVERFAEAFAYAEYPLWHANQAARYNILNGIMPPESGHWLNNPHADDIDFQIEADFAGIMSPGMPITSAEICDKIGHIMNYGDGWYGGVYVASMYTLAFITDDIDFIVREALNMIPAKSTFYKMMADVISWSEQNEDWKVTWQLLQDKWGNHQLCPQGFSDPFNIEASINCAYIIIGLLYGEGDMGKTVDISTRCGDDSDCNPSNAGGILGTAIGYSNIPDYWLNNVKEVEDIVFPFTSLSLNDTYLLSKKHALELIERNGGVINNDEVTILCQQTAPVRFEQSFKGITPVKKEMINKRMPIEGFKYDFSGAGILISARYPGGQQSTSDYVAEVEVYLNGELVEVVLFPADFLVRKLDIFWDFELPQGNYTLELKVRNPDKDYFFNLTYVVVYDKTNT